MDLFQRIDRVKPMEGRRSGDEIEEGRLEIRGLERSRHDIKTRVVDRGAKVVRKPAIRLDGNEPARPVAEQRPGRQP
jgi:hypothetical protein